MPSQDFEEFIGALNAHGVNYLIIGAHAVAYYSIPRATKDLDIFIEPTEQNAEKLLQAMKDFFGGVELGYTIDDILDPAWILQLGVIPLRIDLLSELSGITSFKAAWKNRKKGKFGNVPAYYLGLEDLIKAKKASGRIQDKADLQKLNQGKRSKKK